MIYTRSGVIDKKSIDSPKYKINGFSKNKEFYSPKYDVSNKNHKNKDYRSTLYWNPYITTNDNGNATIEFFNSDTAKQIQVIIEGLTIDGIPGTYSHIFFGNKK